MCGQFEIVTTIEELKNRFGAGAEHPSLTEYLPGKRIVPYTLAPVIVEEEGKRELRVMRFSLLPSWAKEPKLKFSTFNARLDSIDTKATWKRPFVSNHCVVPLTGFFEAIYEGPYAGTMVRLTSTEDEILLAAGIYDRWRSPTGEFLESFAIITDEPSPFVRSVGHDRQPLTLAPEGASAWLAGTWGRDPGELKRALLLSKVWPELKVSKDRDLKPGWEKRRRG